LGFFFEFGFSEFNEGTAKAAKIWFVPLDAFCPDALLVVISLPMVKCSAHTYPPFAYMLPESSKR
jgi:hypothetical protein